MNEYFLFLNIYATPFPVLLDLWIPCFKIYMWFYAFLHYLILKSYISFSIFKRTKVMLRQTFSTKHTWCDAGPIWKGFHFSKAEKSLEELFLSDICTTLSLKQKLICKSGLSLVPKSVNSTSHYFLHLFSLRYWLCAYWIGIL